MVYYQQDKGTKTYWNESYLQCPPTWESWLQNPEIKNAVHHWAGSATSYSTLLTLDNLSAPQENTSCQMCPLPIQNIESPKTAMLVALQSCKQVQWHLEQYASPSSASWSWQCYHVDFTIIIQSMAGMKRMDLVSLMLETSRWRVKFVLKGALCRGLCQFFIPKCFS